MNIFIKKALFGQNWLCNNFVKYQEYVESYMDSQIESFCAHCVV